ncbi:MAG: DUF262 domain-containing protein [Nostocaceae cyanobacterium]|nr:DUF262 domain-containing protein [Nostocaceae cyanobacterium]
MTILTENNAELPEIDTLDEENDEELYEKKDFQYDPEEINIVTKEPTIEQLLRRINEEALNLAPDFQRQAGVWKDEAKSRLIESILIRIPLPAFYIDASTDEDEWLVVDGLQRLSALKQFVSDNQLKLSGLEYLKELHGKTYEQLERRYQRRILETQVTVYLIEKGTPVEVKYNIFQRINTGGVSLSKQELRHALNPGNALKFLAQLASLTEFKRVVNLSKTRIQRMEDREFVLGFLAFLLTSYRNYKAADRDAFLNKALFDLNHLSQDDLSQIKNSFRKVMVIAFDIFGEKAFQKLSNRAKRKFPPNKSLFEAWSVSLSQLNDTDIQKLKARKQELINKFIIYVDGDKEFLASISQAANKVEYRFSVVEKIIQEVLS